MRIQFAYYIKASLKHVLDVHVGRSLSADTNDR